MANKVVIAELDLNTEAFLKQATDTKAVIDSLRIAQKQLDTSTQAGREEYVKNEVAIKRLSAQYNEQKNVLTSLNNVNKEYVTVEQAVTKAIDKQVVSIAEARKNNTELLKIKNQLNLKTKEGIAANEAINKKLDENNKFIKENADAYTKQKINIGNYEGALRSVFPQLAGVIEQAKALKEGLIAQQVAMKAGIVSMGGMSGALQVLKVALISTGIGAIVVALGSLIAFLTTTQRGIDAVTSVTRPLQAVFSSLLGVIQNVGSNLFDAFSKPKVVLQDLLDFIKGQVVNRMKSFSVLLDGIKNFDTKKITDGMFQLTTGVTNVTDKTAKALNNVKAFGAEAIKKGQEIDRLQKEIEKDTLNWNRAQIKVKDELDKQFLIMKDTSKSMKEREVAAQKYIEIQKQNGAEEAKIVQKQIDRLAIEQTLNDTKRTGQQEMIDLQTKLDNAKDRSVEAEKETLRVMAQVRKDAQANVLQAQKDAQAKKEQEQKLREQEAAQKTADEQKELDRLKSFEDRKRALLNEIELQNTLDEQEKAVLKVMQETEEQLIDLENISLREEEKLALQKLIIERGQNEIGEIVNKAAHQRVQEQLEFDKQEIDLAQAKAHAQINIAQQISSTLLGILGDSLAGQLAGIALDAIMNIARVKINTSAAQQTNLAQATASAPPPLNVPFIAAATAQNIALGVKSKLSQNQILTSAAISGLGAIAKSFYSGGYITDGVEIPRHLRNEGGDDVLIQAKRGEVVLNEQQQQRAGGRAFFNSIGVPAFANGGFVGSVTQPLQQANVSTDRMIELFAQRVNDIKIVAIEDEITTSQVRKANIVSGANF